MSNSYFNAKMSALAPYKPEPLGCRVRMDANESFMVMPDYIRDAFAEAVRKLDFNRYPDPMATRITEQYGKLIGVDAANLTAGNGSDELINVCLSSLAMKGDTVLLVTPDFSMYEFYARQSELRIEQYDKGVDFRIDEPVLVRCIKAIAPRIVIMSNPCSPTGRGITRTTMLRILDSCPEPIYIIDEAYMDFWNESILQDALTRPNVVVLKTCSKAIGIAALRLGFAAANSELTGVLRSAKSPYNVDAATQAMAECLFAEKRYLNKCIASIRLNIESLVKGLKYVEAASPEMLIVYPTCTNFVFLRVPDETVHSRLVSRGFMTRGFGRYLRVTAASEAENKEFVNALSDIIIEMKREKREREEEYV